MSFGVGIPPLLVPFGVGVAPALWYPLVLVLHHTFGTLLCWYSTHSLGTLWCKSYIRLVCTKRQMLEKDKNQITEYQNGCTGSSQRKMFDLFFTAPSF